MVGALAAAVITAGWCGILPALGPRLGFVDRPDNEILKVHTRPAVALAGPGLLLGLITGLTIAGTVPVAEVIGLVAFTLLGVIDDRFQLSPTVRILVEVAAAVLVSARWWPQGVGLALTGALVIFVAVNAVNLYDGIDGLAGGTGVVGLAMIAAVAALADAPRLLPALLAAALVGFLPFNRHPAKVFLGDGGAYLVGAVTAIALWDVGTERGWYGSVAALGFLGMFGVDLIVTIIRRMRVGAPLFVGDRRHLYDVMVSAGISVTGVAIRLVVAHLAVVALVGSAVLLLDPPRAAATVAALGMVAVALGLRRTARSPA